MTIPEFNFRELIKKDRDDRVRKEFEGTFLDYLDIVKENPKLTILSHQRLFDLIISKGLDIVRTDENPRLRRIYGNDVIKKYAFFEDDFFGIDKTIMKIVRYFHSAAMAGEEARQVLYLVGPVGAGKSSLMEALKNALECAKF